MGKVYGRPEDKDAADWKARQYQKERVARDAPGWKADMGAKSENPTIRKQAARNRNLYKGTAAKLLLDDEDFNVRMEMALNVDSCTVEAALKAIRQGLINPRTPDDTLIAYRCLRHSGLSETKLRQILDYTQDEAAKSIIAKILDWRQEQGTNNEA